MKIKLSDQAVRRISGLVKSGQEGDLVFVLRNRISGIQQKLVDALDAVLSLDQEIDDLSPYASEKEMAYCSNKIQPMVGQLTKAIDSALAATESALEGNQ